MKNLVFALFLLLLTGCASSPPNLSLVKADLYKYHDDGRYDRDVAALFAEAGAYIRSHADVPKPAIVLDIDETSLSNWPELKANDLTFKLDGPCNKLPHGPCGLDAFHERASTAAIAPALQLFREAKAQNIAVFFITGRKEFLREATTRNLKHVGYKNFDGLSMRPNNGKGPPVLFKAPARAALESRGYTIIATIGDQHSDLEGGHTGRTFKVPNPYYELR